MIGLQQTLPADFKLSVYAMTSTKNYTLQGWSGGFNLITANISKSLLKDKLNLSLMGMMGLNKGGNINIESHSQGKDFTSHTLTKVPLYGFTFTVSYTFGNSKRQAQQHTSRIQNDYIEQQSQGEMINSRMKEFLKDLYEAMGGRHLSLWLVQVAVWAIIILALPMATWLSTQNAEAARTSFNVVFDLLLSPFLVYFVNFYVFGPILFFMNEKEARAFRLYNKLSNRTRYLIFALCNLIAIPLFNSKFFMIWWHRNSIPDMPEMTTDMWIGFFSGMFMFFLLNCIVAAIAIGIRHFIRTRQIRQQLKDEQAKHTEAELAWLKNQINPHFLFNTLNNISSLTQIDPERTRSTPTSSSTR